MINSYSDGQMKRISQGFVIQIEPVELPIIPHSARLKWLVDTRTVRYCDVDRKPPLTRLKPPGFQAMSVRLFYCSCRTSFSSDKTRIERGEG